MTTLEGRREVSVFSIDSRFGTCCKHDLSGKNARTLGGAKMGGMPRNAEENEFCGGWGRRLIFPICAHRGMEKIEGL
jgi:hypothetical protein